MKIQEIKIGTKVNYYPYSREDGSFDGITPTPTNITSEPWELGHGAIVCKVKGVSGGVLITHLEPIN